MRQDVAIDVETTTFENGSPFSPKNRMVTVSLKNNKIHEIYKVDENTLDIIRKTLAQYNHLVGFNIKFDLHWLKRYNLLPEEFTVHDAQLHYYIESGQTKQFPSLNEVAAEFNLPVKPDKIAEYWDSGVDTPDIPWEELKEYALHDTYVTWEIYKQQEVKPIHRMNFLDLLVLQEMEWNGLHFDREKALSLAEQNNKLIEETTQKLNLHHNLPFFNWGSNDHLSALLFGGCIVNVEKEPVGFYKSGQKKGQVKYRNVDREYKLPRLFKPKNKTDSGKYSVDEESLQELAGGGELIDGILKVKSLRKDNSTYLLGFPGLQDKLHYPKDYIYGNFNQTTTKTGRLSSNSPNLQNCSDTILSCFTSRYD